jgi:hypothetical protein
MDSLQGQPYGTALPRGGASDDEGQQQLSPAAAQLATGGEGMVRHWVEEPVDGADALSEML